MGVVIKQSFWGTTLAYIGVIIGYINTLILKPWYLDIDQIGLINLVVSNALLVAPFVSLGMPGTLVRYYTYFEGDRSQQRQFYSFQFFIILIANILLGFILYISLDWIKQFFEARSQLYNEYIYISFIIIFFYSFYLQLQAYSQVVLDIVFPSVLKEIVIRIGNAVLILLFGLTMISFDTTVKGLVVLYIIILLLLMWHLASQYEFRLVGNIFKISKKWLKELYQYGSYTFANAIAGSVYFNISFLLIAALIGLDANGIFTTCFYIGIIIEMPRRSMAQITGPILAREFKKDNLKNIQSLYQRGSLTLGAIGILLLLGIVCNLDDLFRMIPKGSQFAEGYFVVIAVATAKLIDMIFGLNGSVLAFSNYYKYNVYFLVITAIILFVMNIILIPYQGINGAAIAFIVSTVIFNLLKYFFIKRRLRIYLFSYQHVKLIFIGVVLLVFFFLIPLTGSPIINIVIKSVLISVSYLVLIYYFKISSDINNWFHSILQKYFNIKLS